MIEKLRLDKDISEMQINIWEKLNEIIDVVNSRTTMKEEYPELAKLVEKAITTGNRTDLRNYLELKPEIGL